ncbi:Uncharacterized protein APZ42_022917 [Daphnia magna]|uniref:Uncharacterized protein n=1 Tax=Daphnia magna TaxID=35525 RepID=A0A164VX82_9CRUS|nr:Uncharacterized protein APZ42_022917 [Daphnia magna]
MKNKKENWKKKGRREENGRENDKKKKKNGRKDDDDRIEEVGGDGRVPQFGTLCCLYLFPGRETKNAMREEEAMMATGGCTRQHTENEEDNDGCFLSYDFFSSLQVFNISFVFVSPFYACCLTVFEPRETFECKGH